MLPVPGSGSFVPDFSSGDEVAAAALVPISPKDPDSESERGNNVISDAALAYLSSLPPPPLLNLEELKKYVYIPLSVERYGFFNWKWRMKSFIFIW